MTDRYRQAVYDAEDQWSSLIDRGGQVDFFGSNLEVPVQMRFGRLEEVVTYVGHVCDRYGIQAPSIRHRKGGMRAHYSKGENSTVDNFHGEIAIPSNELWAMRESVVLHEVAHHVCVHENGGIEHGPAFASVMLVLVREHMGHEAELLLRTGYSAAGVPIEQPA